MLALEVKARRGKSKEFTSNTNDFNDKTSSLEIAKM
jgi:hypothetical protein